jgi:hypothetical protein
MLSVTWAPCASVPTVARNGSYRLACRRVWRRLERNMLLSTLQRLGRSAFDASSFLFGPAGDDPVRERPVDLHSLEARLRAAQVLAQPGFMALHAVRDGAHIVDFEWDNASLAATRLLLGGDRGLIGARLVELLAGRPGRGAIFDHYRRVVEFGAARAIQQPVERNQCVEVLRHAAVRLRDGVAVRLTNLNAVRREIALRREIHARALMHDSRAHA